MLPQYQPCFSRGSSFIEVAWDGEGFGLDESADLEGLTTETGVVDGGKGRYRSFSSSEIEWVSRGSDALVGGKIGKL